MGSKVKPLNKMYTFSIEYYKLGNFTDKRYRMLFFVNESVQNICYKKKRLIL